MPYNDYLEIWGDAELIYFDHIEAITGGNHLEESETKAVDDNFHFVIWLCDDSQGANYHTWHTDIKKEDKLKAFLRVYNEKKIYPVQNETLAAAGIKYARIIRYSIEHQEDLIILSIDLAPKQTLEEKKQKRNKPVLKEAKKTEDTKTATESKKNQAEEEQTAVNEWLKKIDDMLKKFYEKK